METKTAKAIEKPMLFSGPMVRAILEGHKTQTRRIIKIQPPSNEYQLVTAMCSTASADNAKIKRGQQHSWAIVNFDKGFPDIVKSDDRMFSCPHPVGSLVWVRETLIKYEREPEPTIQYAATCTAMHASDVAPGHWMKGAYWQWGEKKCIPSIFMPRWASRLSLRVTGVRVEWLLDISESDARAEGFDNKDAFIAYWITLNGSSIEPPPFVFVYTFTPEAPDARR